MTTAHSWNETLLWVLFALFRHSVQLQHSCVIKAHLSEWLLHLHKCILPSVNASLRCQEWAFSAELKGKLTVQHWLTSLEAISHCRLRRSTEKSVISRERCAQSRGQPGRLKETAVKNCRWVMLSFLRPSAYNDDTWPIAWQPWSFCQREEKVTLAACGVLLYTFVWIVSSAAPCASAVHTCSVYIVVSVYKDECNFCENLKRFMH